MTSASAASESGEPVREVGGLVVLRSCGMCSRCVADVDTSAYWCDAGPHVIDRPIDPSKPPPAWCPWRME